jgi:hypothetical protein
MVDIFIPSRSRYANLKTIYNLSESLWKNVKLVVPHEQFPQYQRIVPMGIGIIPFNETIGVDKKREFMLHLNTTGKIIMMDDDLKFYKRTGDGKRFPPATNAETELMVIQIVDYLDRYPMVGLVDKFMSQSRPRGFVECTRFNQVLGFNRDLLPQPWPQFNVQHDEEHSFHLQLLTRGYKTAVLTEWSKADKPNSRGGCSDWRNEEIMRQTHEKLLELWPEIVTITPDPARARYNWKKAKEIGGL